MVDDLQARLDLPAALVWDEKGIEWDTGRRAWLAHDPACTHHLVLQDDAVIPADLIAGVEKALTHVSDQAAVSLYFGRWTPMRNNTTLLAADADRESASWLAVRGLHWGVGVVLPVPVIPAMVAWGDRNGGLKYDRRISAWLAARHMTTWYSWPSLVDHRDAPSLLPGHGKTLGRVAHRFLGADRSALDFDGSGRVLHVDSLRGYGTPRQPSPRRRDPMPPGPVVTVSGEVLVARDNGSVTVDGRRVRIIRGRTLAHADSWIAKSRPQLWRPVRLDFTAADAAPPAPAEPDPEPPAPVVEADLEPSAPKPPAKDVRAWAKDAGVDVPASGPIPAAVVEQYQAAHQVTEW